MFQTTKFADVAHVPHGQTVHVKAMRDCEEWVVLDWRTAWSQKYGLITLNWPVNAMSENMHWEWECDHGA